jgi:hypothetical protein
MRATLLRVGLVTAPLLGCGFDSTGPSTQNPTSGGNSGLPAPTGGMPTTIGGGGSGNGGAAGQPLSTAGAAGMPITPVVVSRVRH